MHGPHVGEGSGLGGAAQDLTAWFDSRGVVSLCLGQAYSAPRLPCLCLCRTQRHAGLAATTVGASAPGTRSGTPLDLGSRGNDAPAPHIGPHLSSGKDTTPSTISLTVMEMHVAACCVSCLLVSPIHVTAGKLLAGRGITSGAMACRRAPLSVLRDKSTHLCPRTLFCPLPYAKRCRAGCCHYVITCTCLVPLPAAWPRRVRA